MSPARPHQARQVPEWVRQGLLELIKGTFLGILVAVTLLVISKWVFPSLRDFDFDFGLRMSAFATEYLEHRSTGLVPQSQFDSYVFLDVDPEPWHQNARTSACEALATHFRDRYNAATSLACQGGRPINRYLLAHLVEGLRARAARLIVLDIDLSPQQGVIADAENRALQTALSDREGDSTPILLPVTIDSAWQIGPANYVRAASQVPQSIDFGGSSVIGAVALAAPGEPVRRYPKCYGTISRSRAIPSLPFMAASFAQNVRDSSVHEVCTAVPLEAPRIVYTLPSLSYHQDSARESQEGLASEDENLRRWSTYRRVYNRCLASYFWDSRSPCGSDGAYRNKIVVVGASNRARRDRHSTPLGNMTGAEVVINATRSFALYPAPRDPPLGEALADELKGVAQGALIWSLFFFFQSWMQHRGDAHPFTVAGRIRRGSAVGAVFFLVMAVNVALILKQAAPTFSMIAAVLGIALEQYIDAIGRCLQVLDMLLRKALRIPLLLVVLSPLSYWPQYARAQSCPEGVFAIEAQVVLVDPADAKAIRKRRDGTQQPIGLDELLCAGESLSLSRSGPVKRVLLYQGGRTVTLVPGDEFTNPKGVVAYAGQAYTFMSDFSRELGNLGRPPDLAVDTTTRGGADPATAPRLVSSRFLSEALPAQKLTLEIAPLVSWNEGRAPFTCLARAEAGNTLSSGASADGQIFCRFAAVSPEAANLLVRDERGDELRWTVLPVKWMAVPRPEWIHTGIASISTADRTAWALWLWTKAEPEWRLQALAMLNELAPQEFIAGYARDHILAGSVDFAPR